MAGRKKLKVVTATTAECNGKTFPEVVVISNPASVDPEKIEELGRAFMKYISEHMSGTFTAGMRKYMLENPITVSYRGEEDDSDISEDK